MRWVVTILFLPMFSFAEVGVPISKSEIVHHTAAAFIATDQSEVDTKSFNAFLSEVSRKRDNIRNEKVFLEFVFNSAHRKFLKRFKEYSSFGELLEEGSYNCLTATALFALLLEHANVKYEIIETNYHIFLIAYTDEGRVLIETTDPADGFVATEKDIESRISLYKRNRLTSGTDDKREYYQLDCNLYNTVELEEMVGLLHYNLAIAAHNDHQLEASVEHLDQATDLYNSPRMEALTRLVLLSVVESKMDADAKTAYIKRIQAFRKRNLMALAQASR